MRRTMLLATASVVAAAGFAPAQAQITADAQDAFVVEDRIIVTTQKREEAAFDVPITLTAYGQDTLELFDVQAFDELSNYVPGLNVQLQSPNNPGWVIRGVTTDSGNFQDPPRISVYLNGVDVSRSRGSAFELFDVERVEIAKGPQATLFGTAASVGAISVITAKPEQEFGAEGYVSFGNYNFVKVGGHVTGGTDVLQGRLAAQFRARDGYIDNVAGDTPNSFSSQDDLQGFETFAIRPSLRFTPNDRFTADLVFNYERNDNPGTSFKSGTLAPTGGDTDANSFAELSGAFGNPLLQFQGFDPATLQPILTPLPSGAVADHLGGGELGLEREIYDVNLQATWDLNDALVLTGIFGYREFDSLEVFDADGSQIPLLEFGEDTEGEQQSYELRINYDAGGRVRGFAGVNYFTEDGFQRAPFALDETLFGLCLTPEGCLNADGSFNRLNPLTGGPVPAALAPGIWYEAEYTNTGETESLSLFADVTFDVTPAIALTAGVRYLDESRESGFSSVFPNSFLVLSGTLAATPPETLGALIAANPGVPLEDLLVNSILIPSGGDPALLSGSANTNGELITRSLDDEALLPRFNALWRVNDSLNVYGSIAQGRRAAVFSITQTVDPATGLPTIEPVDEEIVWNYEAGLKSELFDGALSLEAAVFLQQYTDFRVQVTDLSDPTNIIIENRSAGEAENVGFEMSGVLNPLAGLTLIGTFAYLDAETEDDPANGNLAGKRFRLQPEYSGSLTASYRRALMAAIDGFATVNYAYKSEVFFEPDNNPLFVQDELSLVDVKLGLGAADGAWEVSAFGKNVFDEEYIIDAGNTGALFGSPTFIAGPPALWGVELRGRF